MGEITLQKAIESTLETLKQQYEENNEKLKLSKEEYEAVVKTIKGLDTSVPEPKLDNLIISEDINIEDISDEHITEIDIRDKQNKKGYEDLLENS